MLDQFCESPCHTSHVTRHTSHVTRHTSHVTRHTSHATRHLNIGHDSKDLFLLPTASSIPVSAAEEGATAAPPPPPAAAYAAAAEEEEEEEEEEEGSMATARAADTERIEPFLRIPAAKVT